MENYAQWFTKNEYRGKYGEIDRHWNCMGDMYYTAYLNGEFKCKGTLAECSCALFGRFRPIKREALDGKIWWVVYDYLHGIPQKLNGVGVKWKTRKECQSAIDWALKNYPQSVY
jgi:hypothetical protein